LASCKFAKVTTALLKKYGPPLLQILAAKKVADREAKKIQPLFQLRGKLQGFPVKMRAKTQIVNTAKIKTVVRINTSKFLGEVLVQVLFLLQYFMGIGNKSLSQDMVIILRNRNVYAQVQDWVNTARVIALVTILAVLSLIQRHTGFQRRLPHFMKQELQVINEMIQYRM